MQPQETNGGVVSAPMETIIQPPSQPELEIHTKKVPRQRHYLILFFFTFMWGTFGVDRMYMGYIGTGILKLLTLGGFGFWTLADMIVIMTGTFKDKEGRPVLQFDEYKKFGERTVFWFSVIVGLIVLLNGILLILSITQLAGMFQNGGLNSIPGLNQLTGGTDQAQIQSLMNP